MAKSKKFYVAGDPIKHSQSPMIHNEFASQFEMSIEYLKIEVSKNDLRQFLSKSIANGISGINFTLPLKEEAYHLVDKHSRRAAFARAVNTIWVSGEDVCSDNTDGIGLVRDLEKNIGISLSNKRVLIAGAGGAARGILGPILDQLPSLITVTNRTRERSVSLSALAPKKNVQILDWGEEPQEPFDLILNCTSLSLSGREPNIKASSIHKDTVCYDLSYGRDLTSFEKWAFRVGATSVFNGLGMLVEQAAEAFYLWHGIFPDTEPVIDKLKRKNIPD